MIQEPWKLETMGPGELLDLRVQRRIRAAAKSRSPARRAVTFLPLERTVYAVVVAVYALYASARAVQVFQEARAMQPRSPVACIDMSGVAISERAALGSPGGAARGAG
jgi:hypothetical protein